MKKLNLSMTNQLVDLVIAEKTSIIINNETISRLNRTKYNFMNQTISKKDLLAKIKKVNTINGLVVKRITKMKYTLDKLTVKKTELLNLLTNTKATITVPVAQTKKIISKYIDTNISNTLEVKNLSFEHNLNDTLIKLNKKVAKDDYIEFWGPTSLEYLGSTVASMWGTEQRVEGRHVPLFHTTEVLLAEVKRIVPNVIINEKRIITSNLTTQEIQTIEKLFLANCAIGYANKTKYTNKQVVSTIFEYQIQKFNSSIVAKDKKIYDVISYMAFMWFNSDIVIEESEEELNNLLVENSQDIFRDMLLAQQKKNLAA